jgi:hypothetical protein
MVGCKAVVPPDQKNRVLVLEVRFNECMFAKGDNSMFARHKADRTRVPLRLITTGGRSIEAETWVQIKQSLFGDVGAFHLLTPLDLRSQAKKLKDPSKAYNIQRA